jgi:hypothetical protein
MSSTRHAAILGSAAGLVIGGLQDTYKWYYGYSIKIPQIISNSPKKST